MKYDYIKVRECLGDDASSDATSSSTSGTTSSTTETTGTTSTTTVTTGAGNQPETDIYLIQSKRSGADYYTEFTVLDGGDFDNSQILTEKSTLTVPGNKVVVSGDFHPVTGDLWVIYFDGISPFDLKARLGKCNKTTGAITDVGQLLKYDQYFVNCDNDPLEYASRFNIFFKRDTKKLYFSELGNAIWEVNTNNGLMGIPDLYDRDNPTQHALSAIDGGIFIAGKESSAGNQVCEVKDAINPIYLPTRKRDNLACTLTGSWSRSLYDMQILLRGGSFHAVCWRGALTSLEGFYKLNIGGSDYSSTTPVVQSKFAEISTYPDYNGIIANAT